MRVGFSFVYVSDSLEKAKNLGYEKVADLLKVSTEEAAKKVEVELKVELNTEDGAPENPYKFTLIGALKRNSVSQI